MLKSPICGMSVWVDKKRKLTQRQSEWFKLKFNCEINLDNG